MTMAFVRGALVGEIIPPGLFGYARLQGAFDGIACQVIGSFIAAVVEQHFGFSDPQPRKSLQLGPIHATSRFIVLSLRHMRQGKSLTTIRPRLLPPRKAWHIRD